MSETRGCCEWCVGFLFTLGLIALFLWLSYRPIRPRYFITEFQVPAIANLTAPPAAAGDKTVNFTLEIENKNKQMGVCHDAVNVSLSYGNGNRSGSVAIGDFYQGHGKTADKTETTNASWLPWTNASHDVGANGTARFHVRVETGYRYKVLLWKGRHHWVSVGADVEVDGEGRKKERKGIRLRSSSAPLPAGARWSLAVAALSVVGAIVLPLPLMLF